MPKRKNWKAKKRRVHLCPRCMHSMRYLQLPRRLQKWAPFEWGWNCKNCPEVFMLDGSINPKENTPEKRYQESQRSIMFETIRSFAFGIKKIDNKKRPGRDPWALSNDGSLASNARDVIVEIIPKTNIVSSGAICEEEKERKIKNVEA